MLKAQRKFRNYAILAVFILLSVLLSVINVIIFTMASQDADETTARIAEQYGKRAQTEDTSAQDDPRSDDAGATPGNGPLGRFGPMGPSSPETEASLRYFTIAFDKDGNYKSTLTYNISAVSESEAIEWASGLVREDIGWTSGTYRYRVFNANGQICVTVIDQGRELLTAYRILIVSVIGGIALLIISFFILAAVGEKLFAPIEEADRKQKKFIEGANREIRLPLTIISANTELLEREHGADDQTHAIRRQVKKLENLVGQLDEIALFEEDDSESVKTDMSAFVSAALKNSAERFEARGLKLDTNISPGIQISARQIELSQIMEELIGNSLKYSLSRVSYSLTQEDERIHLTTTNDCTLEDCDDLDGIFDRFTTLENASEESAGLGLSHVKNIVKGLNGRVSAKSSGGEFNLSIYL